MKTRKRRNELPSGLTMLIEKETERFEVILQLGISAELAPDRS